MNKEYDFIIEVTLRELNHGYHISNSYPNAGDRVISFDKDIEWMKHRIIERIEDATKQGS